MQMTVLIATTHVPTKEEHFHAVCQDLRKFATTDDLTINGILWCEGPGCSNLAIDLDGEEAVIEKFANQFTMQVQPAKWSVTSERLMGDCCALDGLKVNIAEIEVGNNL